MISENIDDATGDLEDEELTDQLVNQVTKHQILFQKENIKICKYNAYCKCILQLFYSFMRVKYN